ncbi:MAG: DUF1622 domain-containing protein [Caldicoprobacterales bacterium]|jgi:uncharacterized membrane protein|nr:DUF1622 domain-containing protein [Clostridiales bacterium]
MLDKILEILVSVTVYGMEFIGILIVIFSGIKALIFFVKGGFRFNNRLVSLTLAEGMNMSLGFLLAGEITQSIITKTIPNLIVLAGIAALRVGLTFVLHWEINEYEKVASEDHPRGLHYENKPL